MVYTVEINGNKYYACEICRLLYDNLEKATACEEYCRRNPGSKSPYSDESIGYVSPEIEPQKVYFKVAPLRGCIRTSFRLCKAGVNIYRGC